MSELQVQRIYKVTDIGIYGFFKEHRFLSNFHVCPVMYQGVIYRSSENAYQAAKTDDIDERNKMQYVTPSDSKKLGRLVTLRKDWDDNKDIIMLQILLDKFTRNKDLRKLLLATAPKYLEETNWWNDTYWGTCNDIGENKLGKTLMGARDDIQRLKNLNYELV